MFERKIFFSGLSNKFEPSMVFDPSEFEGTRFDLYICKMLISIFSWFFHTILDPLDSTAFSLSRVGMYANHAQTNKQTRFLSMYGYIN